MDRFEEMLRGIKQEVEESFTRAEQKQERERTNQQQRARALQEKEANEFLRSLVSNSKEAKWFERFATHYPTLLEAAIAYQEGLREVEL
jgi:hypothetical protein